jgi:hypothetical protein
MPANGGTIAAKVTLGSSAVEDWRQRLGSGCFSPRMAGHGTENPQEVSPSGW